MKVYGPVQKLTRRHFLIWLTAAMGAAGLALSEFTRHPFLRWLNRGAGSPPGPDLKPVPVGMPVGRAQGTPIFEDVPADHWAREYIEALYLAGYVAGSRCAAMDMARVMRSRNTKIRLRRTREANAR